MIQPLKKTYPITTPFKYKSNLYYNGYHTGVDFATPTGTQVVAANAGTVVASQFDTSGFGYGEYITIYDGKYYWRYAHLNHRSVGKGTKVKTGQLIGRTGNTGLSSGPHLHFECSTSNSFSAPISSYRDPLKVIKDNKGVLMIDQNLLNVLIRFYWGRTPNEADKRNLIGKPYAQGRAWIQNHSNTKVRIANAKAGKLNPINHAPQAIRKAYKPPQVVDDYEEVKEKLYRRK